MGQELTRGHVESAPSRWNPQVSAHVNEDLLVEVKILAARQRRRFKEWIEEALQDLLKKYREKRK